MLIRKCSLVLVTGALLGIPAIPQPDGQPAVKPSKVVFVCEHGAAKSVIAAAHFNKLAKERGLEIRAIARGTNPDTVVSPKVVAGLRSEGVTEISQKPELVREQDISGAKRVITLGCTLPQNTEATDWNDVPSPSGDYSAASHAIRKRVEVLMDELSGAKRTRTNSK